MPDEVGGILFTVTRLLAHFSFPKLGKSATKSFWVLVSGSAAHLKRMADGWRWDWILIENKGWL